MSSIRVIDGKILVVGGSICINDDCCCEADTICTLPTTSAVDVTFSGITDCGSCPCTACDCDSIFNDNTFRCVWNGVVWQYSSGGVTVGVACVNYGSGDKMTVNAMRAVGPEWCFHTATGGVTPALLPQTVSSAIVIGECTSKCGYGGQAIVDVV